MSHVVVWLDFLNKSVHHITVCTAIRGNSPNILDMYYKWCTVLILSLILCLRPSPLLLPNKENNCILCLIIL